MTQAIGIDLGTTYTVVATLNGGRPKIVPNAEGHHLTPSVVSFSPEGEILVGQPARRNATISPLETVFSIKRSMGSGESVRAGGRGYTPQEISGFILRKVKSDAEVHVGEKIEEAVITVPAYFNELQRRATMEAAAFAGLHVPRLLNEPTAAALAYGLEGEDVRTVLVWDLGGGTFDVSILEVGEGIFEVRAVSGDTWLGGDDVDRRVMDYLAVAYKREHGIDLPSRPAVRQSLREAAEATKVLLSFVPKTKIHLPLPGSSEPWPLDAELTREHLESLVGDLLERMAVCTQQALNDAGLAPAGIERVVLVGGATRMPAVRNLARSLLGREPYRSLDPDKVVALGAAIQAGILAGSVNKVVLLDVLPLSLGVETRGGLTARIIPRNTPLPASASQVFSTAADGQTSMDLHVLQGERELAAGNVSLGAFQLRDIPAAPRGTAKVEVSFVVDVDGLIRASATDLASGGEVATKIASTKFLDTVEIDRLAQEAQRRAGQDKEERERIEVGIQAENLLAIADEVKSYVTGAAAPVVGHIAQASSQLREALASGTTKAIQASNRELEEALAALPQDRRRVAQPAARSEKPLT